ncbi:MAG TPA: hypothetical protein VF485_10540, partial [Sphingomonas sp.]
MPPSGLAIAAYSTIVILLDLREGALLFLDQQELDDGDAGAPLDQIRTRYEMAAGVKFGLR